MFVLTVPRVIKVAKSSQQMEAKLVGDINLKVIVDGLVKDMLLKRVLYAPDLAVNLISVRRLDVAGYCVSFGNGKSSISKDKILCAVLVLCIVSMLWLILV